MSDSLADGACAQVLLVLLAAEAALVIDGPFLLFLLPARSTLHLAPPHDVGSVDGAREDILGVRRHVWEVPGRMWGGGVAYGQQSRWRSWAAAG